MTEKIITAGLVLVTPEEAIQDGAVLVRGKEIAAVGRRQDVLRQAPEAVRHEFPESTLMPGMVNAHVHLVFDASKDFLKNFEAATDDELRAGATGRLAQLLSSGVTTARDLGDRDHLVLSLKSDVRVLSAGTPLTVPGGHCHFFGGEVASDDDIRALIDKNAAAGANLIKVMASGGQVTEGGANMWESQFDARQMALIVEHAGRYGLPVAAHAHGADAIEASVAARVSTIEHCTWMTGPGQLDLRESVARQMAANGIAACPTTSRNWRLMVDRLGEERAGQVYGRLPWLRDHGVPLAAGSDAGLPGSTFDDPVAPMGLYEWLGFTRTDILRQVTCDAADALGLGEVTGRLIAGYDADLLVVGGNPLHDLSAMGTVEFVMARGLSQRM